MISKAKHYQNEQTNIVDKIVNILNLQDNPVQELYVMDRDYVMQQKIMELSQEIEFYYNCNNLKAVTDPSRIKRPWLSIIKTLLKNHYQINTKKGVITTIVDVGINKYTKPDLYLLNDKKKFFLAYIELSQVNNTKMSIKPYLDSFYPFHISAEILKVSGRALWQGSNIFQK